MRLYLPPGYANAPDKRYPVIYMHDGQNLFDDATSYAGEWGVDETLDAMAASQGFEAIVVGLDNGGEHRMQELNPFDHPRFGPGEGEAYLAFMVETLKPWIDGLYRTLPDPAAKALTDGNAAGDARTGQAAATSQHPPDREAAWRAALLEEAKRALPGDLPASGGERSRPSGGHDLRRTSAHDPAFADSLELPPLSYDLLTAADGSRPASAPVGLERR